MKEENTYRQTIPSSTTGRYTALTRKAMRICYAAHEGQMDKSGVPYVFHPIHLAEQMETEEEICTALLHDVVEDTKWTLKELEAEGFPTGVLEAVRLLTREKDVPYMAYIERLSGNQIARSDREGFEKTGEIFSCKRVSAPTGRYIKTSKNENKFHQNSGLKCRSFIDVK